MKNVGHCGCLTKKNCQLKLSKMTKNTFNILRGKWCKFPLSIGFLRNCLRLTSVSQFFRFWIKMRVFNFLMIKVDDRIASGNFRVSRKLISWLKCLCNFRKVIESKFTCHFRFLQIYHSVSKQFQPWCYAQNNLFITFIGNMTF